MAAIYGIAASSPNSFCQLPDNFRTKKAQKLLKICSFLRVFLHFAFCPAFCPYPCVFGHSAPFWACLRHDKSIITPHLKALRASPKTISPNAANAGAVWSGSNWPSAACCGWAKPATCPRSLPICLPAPPALNRSIARSPKRLPLHCNGWFIAANHRANKIQIRQPENT